MKQKASRYPGIVLCACVAIVAGCGAGTPAVTANDDAGAMRPLVTSGKPTVKPASLKFTSKAKQTFVVRESGYSGKLLAVAADKNVAKVTPPSAKGPSATFAVTPVGGGTTTVTIENASGKSVKLKVTVANGVIIVDHSNRLLRRI